MDREKLQEEVEKLDSLLKGQEHGCFTWWMFLDARIDAICKLYYGESHQKKHKESYVLQSSNL